MPDPVTGVLGAVSVGGSILSSKASSKASRAQVQAAEQGAAEQRAAREELRRLLQPYTAAGPVALQGMLDLIGLGGTGAGGTPAFGTPTSPAGPRAGLRGGFYDPEFGFVPMNAGSPQGAYPTATGQPQLTQAQRQNQAIQAQAQNPLFLALAQQGEEGILQNASATGGLRGGNLQGALAQFRPALLNQFINQQYDRLAGITALGQQSAAGVGAGALQTGTNIASLLADAGAARAGNAVAQGNTWSRLLGGIGGIATDVLNRPSGGGAGGGF